MNRKFFIMAAALLTIFTTGCKKDIVDPEQQPAPELISISPESGIAGQSAVIAGKNFTEAVEVWFAEAKAEVTFASATELKVMVPENQPGEVEVKVVVGEKSASGLKFTYVAPSTAAEVTGISPASAKAGTSVALTGVGFGTSSEGKKVLFNEAEAVITAVEDNSITVTVPESDGSAKATVLLYIDDERVAAPQEFTYAFDKTVSLGAVTGTIFEAGSEIAVPVDGLSEDDEVTVTFVGAQNVVAEEVMVEDGGLTVFVPAKLKGDYRLKVAVEGALPVETPDAFAVWYLPKYRVELFAGAYEASSNVDGVGSDARFKTAEGLTWTPDGKSLWVTVRGGSGTKGEHQIRAVEVATATVSTVIGGDQITTNMYPYAGAFNSKGEYHVACKVGNSPFVGKVVKDGEKYVWSTYNLSGVSEGYSTTAWNPMAMLFDDNDNLYITDRNNARIIVVSPDGTVSKEIDLSVGDNHIQPVGIAWDAAKENIIIGTDADYLICSYNLLSGNTTVLAGNGLKPTDKADGTNLNFTDGTSGDALSACIGQINGIFVDSDGYVYFNDGGSKAFRVLVPGVGGDYTKGVVKTLLGNPTITSSADGTIESAGLPNFGGIVKGENGSFYIVGSYAIRKISPIAE